MAIRLTAPGYRQAQPGTSRRENAGCRLPRPLPRSCRRAGQKLGHSLSHRGKPTKFTLGPYPRLDLGTARDRARQALALVDRGIDPRQAPQGRASGRGETPSQHPARSGPASSATSTSRRRAGPSWIVHVGRLSTATCSLSGWGTGRSTQSVVETRTKSSTNLVEKPGARHHLAHALERDVPLGGRPRDRGSQPGRKVAPAED